MTRALGRYELLRPLARGGMAEVYLARRRAAGIEKWLVVKRMRPQHSRDPRFLDLFVREARLSMSLVHQNIVPVFDFGRIDDEVFLAMERVEGKDLGSSLARSPTHRVPPLLAAFIAAECCQALDYAHQRKSPDGVALGVVHRDVTPRNVLLSWSGEVKLTDFGIAALAGDATERLLGTPQYMAPEQARGEPIDPRADIYAIGLVLREALSGARARPGDDRNTILDAARRGALLPWSHLVEASDERADGEPRAQDAAREKRPPEALVAIIDRATAAEPGDRYPDARSMLEDLDAFIVGERAAHRAEPPARQLAVWLAGVWDGARDDAELDGGIDADHLVSFLDDGALDIIGTGTVRSMAATAAEDVLPATPDATPPPPVPRPGDSAGRRSLISSSASSVASGSFEALVDPERPGTTDLASSTTTPLAKAPPFRLARAAGILAVAIAGVAAVVLGTSTLRSQSQQAAIPLAPSAIPTTSPAPIAEPPAQPPPAQPPPTQPPPARPPPTQPARAQQTPTQPSMPRSPPAPSTQPVSTKQPSTERDVGSAGRDGGPGSASVAGVDVGDAGPVLCRVRINLTPWAYYRVDGDALVHETPSTIDLAPGPHRLHVWNPQLGIERDIVIQVPADRATMNYSEPLRPPTLDDAGVAPQAGR
jgi:eukaryotic-like serine/threonine-protein kinase